jgi:hypothetical protein
MLVGGETNFSFRLTLTSLNSECSGAGDDYIDLFNTYLFVEAQIVNTDGSNLEPDTDVGPVDLWMHSLFSDVSVSLNV